MNLMGSCGRSARENTGAPGRLVLDLDHPESDPHAGAALAAYAFPAAVMIRCWPPR